MSRIPRESCELVLFRFPRAFEFGEDCSGSDGLGFVGIELFCSKRQFAGGG